jgi:PAS domain-containing protein
MNKVKDSELSAFSIMDASPECVKIINVNGTVEYINNAGLEIVEVADDQSVIGASVYDFILDDYRESWRNNHTMVCAGKPMVWQYEVMPQAQVLHLKRKKGQVILSTTCPFQRRERDSDPAPTLLFYK